MFEKSVQLNGEAIKGRLKELAWGGVEETLNEVLEAKAEELTQAVRYQRDERRRGYRSGRYGRNPTVSGDVTLKVLKHERISFGTVLIERHRRRESGAKEALIEMSLVGGRYPWYRMMDNSPTWVERVYHLADVARKYLRYVDTGNCR